MWYSVFELCINNTNGRRRVVVLSKNRLLIGALTVTLVLVGCTGKEGSSNVIENGLYEGKGSNNHIIDASSGDGYILKNKLQDDSNYGVIEIVQTGDKLHEFEVYNFKLSEVYGDVGRGFMRPEGREFVIIQGEEELYLRSLSEDLKQELSATLEEVEDREEYLKNSSNFKFNRE